MQEFRWKLSRDGLMDFWFWCFDGLHLKKKIIKLNPVFDCVCLRFVVIAFQSTYRFLSPYLCIDL